MIIDSTIKEIAIDSRSVKEPAVTLFFALKGKNHNGHNYIQKLYDAGVRHFVVSESRAEYESMEGARFELCNDTLEALQNLAALHRAKSKAQVVGITGSNGKTVVKEWIAQLLSDDMRVCRSPGSYNSQVGVPLSLLSIEPDCEVALIEAGMSRKGEMVLLEKMIHPSVGIFTHLGDAHGENFSSIEEKLQEKITLFKGCDTVICRGGSWVKEIESVMKNGAKTFVWQDTCAASKDTDVLVETLQITSSDRFVSISYPTVSGREPFELDIPFPDDASFENCMNAVCYLLLLGYDPRIISRRVRDLQPIAMRMEIKEGINRCILIKDYYNSDLASFALALNTLAMQDASRRKVVILSDFVDVGAGEKQLYLNVAKLLHKVGVSVFIGVGEKLSGYKSLFEIEQTRFYPDTDSFIKQENRDSFKDEVILIKGARQYRFEYIAGFLQKQSHTTLLEVDLDAMADNLNYFRSKLSPDTRIAVMVKAFSYGSGSGEVASLLQYHGVNYLMVAFSDEGVELRSKGITIPIAVMNPEPEAFDNMIEFGLEPEIYSLEVLEEFNDALQRHGAENYPVHLKVNTGMNRSGLNIADIPSLLDFFSVRRHVMLRSVFSHLAASDDSSQDDFTLGQIALFRRIVDLIQPHFDYKILRHILNSAGIERFTQYQFDMVRLGIGLHGIGVSGSGKNELTLRPVSSFITHIASIRNVPANETVGYGRKGHLSRDSRIAIIPVGYADGLNRRLSCGVGQMFVRGRRVPIVGNICMDACMLDITDTEAQVGDEVEIFGRNIPVTELAEKLGTIPYEILTSVSSRVKRVYYKDL